MLNFIIFGTKGVTSTAGKGQFHCPQCGPQAYQHKKVKKWFTLYFIPCIPMETLGEYVECQGCKGTYRLEVLKYDPRAEQAALEAEYQTVMRRVMIEMMLADDVLEENEIVSIQEIFPRLTGRQLSREEIMSEADETRRSGGDVLSYLEKMRSVLNSSGRESILRAAAHVAMADGSFAPSEKQFMCKAAEALGVTPAHLNGILAEVQAS